jgi:hypothetical protein
LVGRDTTVKKPYSKVPKIATGIVVLQTSRRQPPLLKELSKTYVSIIYISVRKTLLIYSIAIYNDMGFLGGDWAIISIDGSVTRAKIVHKGRGRYVIIEDSKGGKYVNRVIDAGDIIQVEK